MAFQPTAANPRESRMHVALAATIENRARRIEVEIARSTTGNVLAAHFDDVTLARVREAIPADAALIEWFQFERLDFQHPLLRSSAGPTCRRYAVVVLFPGLVGRSLSAISPMPAKSIAC